MARFVRVTVKPGHPTGSYSRGGYRFYTTPTDLSTRKLVKDGVLELITEDPWLVCSEQEEQEFGEGGVPAERSVQDVPVDDTTENA